MKFNFFKYKIIEENKLNDYREIIFKYREFCQNIRTVNFIFITLLCGIVSILKYSVYEIIITFHNISFFILMIILVIAFGYLIDFLILILWEKSIDINKTDNYYFLTKTLTFNYLLISIIIFILVLTSSIKVFDVSYIGAKEGNAQATIALYIKSYYDYYKKYPDNLYQLNINEDDVDDLTNHKYINFTNYFELISPHFDIKCIITNNEVIKVFKKIKI